jgi:ABC-type sugar transport system ATPase subunit
MADALLSTRNLVKRFGATVALDGVSFDLAAGEVHALIGENGAGKSTLTNIFSGVVQPDAGDILLGGKPVSIASPRHAQMLGIATVFQELSLTETVSISENIFAGRAPSRFGAIDWPRLEREAHALLAELGIDLDVRQPLTEAPVSVRQMVEIAKAISLDARALLLDEPTAALSPVEVKRLFELIRRLAARGLGIVYISHHLSEVLTIADRITVLRDGRVVAQHRPAETDQEGLVRDMVGRDVARLRRGRASATGPVVLEARNLSRPNEFQDVDLVLKAGEIVGITGLMGSYRSELAQALCGILQPGSGEIRLRGTPVRFRGLAHAIAERIAYVPQDRKNDGLFLDMPLAENIAAASQGKVSRLGVFSRARNEALAGEAMARLGIKASGPQSPARALSGGNQQKALLARWLATDPEIIIVDEPTRGVDVAAKHDIHALLAGLVEKGAAVLLISSDMAELLNLSDRLLVMHAGRIVGELDPATTREEDIIALASGPGGDAREQAA